MIPDLALRVRGCFHNHLPTRKDTLQVTATATFLTYTWTMYVSFWQVPSWIYFMNTGQIFSMYAYSFIVNFIESMLLVLLMISLSIVLPIKWWRDRFVSMSVLTLFVMMTSLLWRLHRYELPTLRDEFVSGQLLWWSATLVILVALSFVLSRFEFLEKWISDLADRFMVFLYIYYPLTVISVVVIIVRGLG